MNLKVACPASAFSVSVPDRRHDADFELPAQADAVSAVAFSTIDPDLLLSAGWDSVSLHCASLCLELEA